MAAMFSAMHWSSKLLTELAVTPEAAGDTSDITAVRSAALIALSQRPKDSRLLSSGSCSEAHRVETTVLRFQLESEVSSLW